MFYLFMLPSCWNKSWAKYYNHLDFKKEWEIQICVIIRISNFNECRMYLIEFSPESFNIGSDLSLRKAINSITLIYHSYFFQNSTLNSQTHINSVNNFLFNFLSVAKMLLSKLFLQRYGVFFHRKTHFSLVNIRSYHNLQVVFILPCSTVFMYS